MTTYRPPRPLRGRQRRVVIAAAPLFNLMLRHPELRHMPSAIGPAVADALRENA